MDPIVNIRIEESGMSIQTIEKEIAAQIRKHEAQLKHWRLVKAATAKLRGAPRNGNGAIGVRKSTEVAQKYGKRTRFGVKHNTVATVRIVNDRAPKRKKAAAPAKLGKLLAGAK